MYIMDQSASNSLSAENFLGALSLAITDRIAEINAQLSEFGGETAAAIIQIGSTANITTNRLSQIIGLSQSATTRLVGKLTDKAVVKKLVGTDARESPLVLTRDGLLLMNALLEGRQALLKATLSTLSAEEIRLLEKCMRKMLHALPQNESQAHHICRLCNEAVCPQDTCPVTTL